MVAFRNVFFSFHYADAVLASQIRQAGQFLEGMLFRDWADWEAVRRTSSDAIKQWISDQMEGTSVTVVLIGSETATRHWVLHEIGESVRRGNGLLGIYLDQMIGLQPHHRHPRIRGLNPFSLFPPRNAAHTAQRGLLGLTDRHVRPTPRAATSGLTGLGLLGHADPAPLRPGLVDFAMGNRTRADSGLRGLLGNSSQHLNSLAALLAPTDSLASQVRTFCWKTDNGSHNIATWIEHAAQQVGR